VTEQEEEEEVERGTAPRLWLSSLYSRLEELHTETEKSRYRYSSQRNDSSRGPSELVQHFAEFTSAQGLC
jgi:hypothetical protein